MRLRFLRSSASCRSFAGAINPVAFQDPGSLRAGFLVYPAAAPTSGNRLVPGNIEVWNEILLQKNDSHVVREWRRHKQAA